ncbi:putative histidine kinase [Leptolyngbya boryana NIES-2135]|jgi:two-component system NtrC family sensor kinase|uniref:histidine kinase n=1 Tax=Leptolyngbya boryana NIES-2135 TaxID=1973484 RepID=A0A1Z4JC09_LEPBY|nr:MULTISPECIES: PAS domain S-box protein [Leptolyngbya]BAY54292.1 putative histidine kinase [Leptolyngbya boryana NIES-2135]MBD2370840.1 PAS domain S-box protein [Leptolyngbya sp. FACHB-161]MBD2377162.1 PAS domain S-box protein [Leptolyngbya sp. FACHB-238]MBD2401628.1 PAS domain S-box protein [Leptolyngbya sp. FACHB-239]MBD2408181.1 PAS domain S-box protein [Leptolyngbya sp. FACHB-402]
MSVEQWTNPSSSGRDRDYQILLDAIPDLILRIDRNGVCLDYHLPKNFKAYGREFDWYGRRLDEIIPAEVAQQQMEYVASAIATNEMQVYEQQIEWNDEIRYEEVRVRRYSETEALVLVRDISAQKNAEKALTQSEARFQRLATNIPGMIYQFRLETDGTVSFPFVSRVSERIYEVEPELIQEDPGLLIGQIHPDDRASFEESIRHSAETLEPWKWSGRNVLSSGKIKWIEGHSQPELQIDGAIVWDGIVTDVSDRKQLEAQRQQAECAIAESEARFRSFVENANDLICAFSPTGLFTYISPKVFEISGFLAKELLGKPLSDFIHPEDLHIVQASIEELLKTGERQSAIEFRARRKDGDWYWALCNTSSIRGSNGGVVSILSIVRDISDRKANEEKLRQQAIDLENALQELQKTQAQLIHSEKMSSLGQLVAGIAHEINNPIGFIHGNIIHAMNYFQDLVALIKLYQTHECHSIPDIEAFIEEINLDFIYKDLQSIFDSMQTGTERIREIVLSLRNFSRLDEAQLKPVNIHDGIESTLTILQSRLHQAESKIIVSKFYNQLPKVECFASSLNQVFLQILTNAIDAVSEVCAPVIEIHTEFISANWVRIRILDSGVGIPESVQARMFDPFFTTKPVGKGTGMGLAISYQIVTDQHHGRLKCQSKPGQGTEFTIELPIRQSQ